MISIVIPTYNRGEKILKAIESVLNQTYEDIELIVVDDGSTDDTKNILKKINDPRFRYIYQDNKGACAARNNGIRNARGEYIALNDSDDIWEVDKLEKQFDTMSNKGADVVFCKLESPVYGIIPEKFGEGFVENPNSIMGIGTQSLLLKKKVFDTICFNEEMPRFQDLELMLQIFIGGKYSVYCLDEALVKYDLSSDSISQDSRKIYEACKIINEQFPKLSSDFSGIASELSGSLIYAAKDSYRLRNKKLCRDSWKLATSLENNKLKKIKINLLRLLYPFIYIVSKN